MRRCSLNEEDAFERRLIHEKALFSFFLLGNVCERDFSVMRFSTSGRLFFYVRSPCFVLSG